MIHFSWKSVVAQEQMPEHMQTITGCAEMR